jgi:alpha-1,2-mannosyltransferase
MRRGWLRVAVLVLITAAASVWCLQAVRKAERRSGNDLVGYLEASRALYAGGDPYHLPDRFPYIYPLFLAAAVRPLASFPVPVASVTWFALQAGCLWYVLRTAGMHAGIDKADRVVAAAVIVAVFGDVVQSEFLNGQVNVIVLALAVAAIHLTNTRPWTAALLLGAAIAVKLTPALFLLYWALERRFRLVIASVVWSAAFILSPWLIVWDRLWSLYDGYLREFIFARTSSVAPHTETIFFTPYGFWGWLTGSAPGRLVIVGSSLAVVTSLVIWKLQHPARTAHESRADAWIFAAAIPFLSPMSEVHHLTALLPAATIDAAVVRRRPRRLFWATAVGLVVFLWVGWADRAGPWYFLSVLCLTVSAGVALQRSANPA